MEMPPRIQVTVLLLETTHKRASAGRACGSETSTLDGNSGRCWGSTDCGQVCHLTHLPGTPWGAGSVIPAHRGAEKPRKWTKDPSWGEPGLSWGARERR